MCSVPFVVRSDERAPGPSGAGLVREWVLAPGRLPDDRLTLEVIHLDAGAELEVSTTLQELAWLQVLAGEVRLDGVITDRDWICMVSGGRGVRVTASEPAALMLARVPRAADYDPAVSGGMALRVDWSTEPVLDSEHDARRRIYLASSGLWGTEAVKGEMIIYPPGASGAAHHHEGAEHFQFLLAGSGTAVLAGTEVPLATGDLLYNLENEEHWFVNRGEDDMVFVEFFVPGQSRTVWAPGVDVCGWNPTDTDIKGRAAARTLEYHVHGQGDV